MRETGLQGEEAAEELMELPNKIKLSIHSQILKLTVKISPPVLTEEQPTHVHRVSQNIFSSKLISRLFLSHCNVSLQTRTTPAALHVLLHEMT